MKLLHSDRGASAVEFAIVILPLILLLMGIVDFGRAYNQQLELSSAAREGARVMAVQKNSTTAQATVLAQAPGATVAITACPLSGSGSTTVTATYPLESLTGFFDFLLDGKTLTGTGVMKCGG